MGFLCLFLVFFLSLKNKTSLAAEGIVFNPSFHQELDVCNSKSLRKEYCTWHMDSVTTFALNYENVRNWNSRLFQFSSFHTGMFSGVPIVTGFLLFLPSFGSL